MPRRFIRRGYGISSFRRRRRFVRRGRARIPNMRRPLRAAATAAASNTTAVRMCKDLGVLWPSCTLVKLKQHFVSYVGSANGTNALPLAYGQGSIVCYPFAPLAALSSVAGWSSLFNDSGDSAGTVTTSALQPVGWGKLIGSADPTIYGRACCLRMQYDLRLVVAPNQPANTGGLPAQLTAAITAYTRPFDATEGILTAPTTQDQADLNVSQPHVRRRYARHGCRITSIPAATAGGVPTELIPPEIRMRGSVWPHHVLEIPWSTYIGNDASFGTSGANPSDLAKLEWAYHKHRPSFNIANDGTKMYGNDLQYMEGFLVFTMLFKDPHGGLT